MNKAVPEGLKNQECEKGNRKKRPPIPYVPVSDEVQEAVSKGKDFSYKIKLPDKTGSVYPSGTQEPKRPFSFTCNKRKARARERGCSSTMTLQHHSNSAIPPISQKSTPTFRGISA
jgi:hypothetical protein